MYVGKTQNYSYKIDINLLQVNDILYYVESLQVSGKKRGRPSKEKQQPAKKARNSAPKKTKPKK